MGEVDHGLGSLHFNSQEWYQVGDVLVRVGGLSCHQFDQVKMGFRVDNVLIKWKLR